MTIAIRILTHAIRMILFDLGTTLRVLTPALALMAGAIALMYALDTRALEFFTGQAVPGGDIDPLSDTAAELGGVGVFLIGMLAYGIGYVLMAVLWHRHVLLEGDARQDAGRPGFGVVLSYVWRIILLALIQFVVMIPLGLVAATLGAGGFATNANGGVVVGTLVGLGVAWIMFWLGLRLSLVLPAISVGTKMTFNDSLNATKPLSSAIWMLALLLAILNVVVGGVGGFADTSNVLVDALVISVINLFVAIVSVSVLTTLYGNLVENRPLPS